MKDILLLVAFGLVALSSILRLWLFFTEPKETQKKGTLRVHRSHRMRNSF